MTEPDGTWQAVLRTRDLTLGGGPLRVFAGFSGDVILRVVRAVAPAR